MLCCGVCAAADVTAADVAAADVAAADVAAVIDVAAVVDVVADVDGDAVVADAAAGGSEGRRWFDCERCFDAGGKDGERLGGDT